MSEITTAIKARQAQITQLQSDIGALESAASILGGGMAKATAAKPKAKAKRKRQKMSAAARQAVSRRMKAYWAKRRKARR